MIQLVIDIETVENDRAKDYYGTKNYEAPSNYKSAESILKYTDAAKDKDRQKAALRSWTGKVICIGYCVVKDYVMIQSPKTFHGDDESQILKSFGDMIIDMEGMNSLELWGWNSVDFDFPFLYDRYRSLNLGVPPILDQRYYLKDVKHLGRMNKSSSLTKRSLNDALWGMELESKSGSGNQVAGWYLEDNWEAISSYCMDDVARTADILIRSRPYRGINIYIA